MKLVSIRAKDLADYKKDPEMLHKSFRPCVLILRLKYKGKRYDFAVPLRSNISPAAPKDQYFPLPPRRSTRPKHRHGIHYIKMFPVRRSSLLKYRTEGNKHAELVKRILDENEKQIVAECQRYLNEYEKGNIPDYATDVDLLIEIMQRTK